MSEASDSASSGESPQAVRLGLQGLAKAVRLGTIDGQVERMALVL